MTTPQRPPRTCQGCGWKFIPDGDQWYCSATCERAAAVAAIYAGLQQHAQATGR